MASWEEKFGPKLLVKGGDIDTKSLDLGDDDILGLYFSAHWCPPCRQFTPKLATFYTKVNEKGGPKLRIVFVSCDRSEKEFGDYFKSMPWHALHFENEKKEKLNEDCGVRGIPKLVFFDSKGNKINDDARSLVAADPDGKNFPMSVTGKH